MGEVVPTARVAIVDDHEVIAQVLAAVLESDGFEVVRVTPSGQDVARELLETAPDLVLLDLDLGPMGDGASAVEPLATAGIPVLVLTGVTDRRRTARCVRLGARAVISKQRPFTELRDAVLTTLSGGEVMTRHEREEELQWLRAAEEEQERRLQGFEDLSPREAEVLGALMTGHQVDDIARDAFVATSTIRSQVRAILRKLRVGSQLAAVARAREAGWEPPVARDSA